MSSPAANENSTCCVICLDPLVSQCETQPCQHKDFDFFCLVTWLEVRATCPLCKSKISEVRYDISEDGKQAKIFKVPERQSSSSGDGGSDSHHSIHARPYEDEVIRRRRLIYQHNLYSLHVGSNVRRRTASLYRELSPQCFSTDPELVSRARIWLRRELRVFQFLNADNSEHDNHHDSDSQNALQIPRSRFNKTECLLEYIVAILKTIDTQDSSGRAEDLIQEFIGRDNTRLLLHELRAWLRSPCRSLSEWDRVVQYKDETTTSQTIQSEEREADISSRPSRASTYRIGRRSGRPILRHEPYKLQRPHLPIKRFNID
ncbi:hypothetical protein B0T17DRAFT_38616 [Bombardia bombarda]|uniref:RING-type E3 ubiquitin transferase n=1 Tax=Bombardia bombarda TaxID=252184 RepID=A0AA39XLQ0_9PEZI|nr:hypothetical protein B0T17DRAFT_38616 [Bombardia bombarda]